MQRLSKKPSRDNLLALSFLSELQRIESLSQDIKENLSRTLSGKTRTIMQIDLDPLILLREKAQLPRWPAWLHNFIWTLRGQRLEDARANATGAASEDYEPGNQII